MYGHLRAVSVSGSRRGWASGVCPGLDAGPGSLGSVCVHVSVKVWRR